MPAIVVLAGGLATRMRPLTDAMPKCLLPVANKPFIYHQLELFQKQGINRVVICTGYLGEMVEDALKGWTEMDISFSRDWPRRLGTGGAIKNALALLDDEFMVIYGDSYLPIDFKKVYIAFKNSGKDGMMTVCRDTRKLGEANAVFDNGLIRSFGNSGETKEWIDYGLSIFKKQAFINFPKYEFDLGQVFKALSEKSQLAGLEEIIPFHEIGSMSGYKEFQDYYQSSSGLQS